MAVTGPTGEIGISAVTALERNPGDSSQLIWSTMVAVPMQMPGSRISQWWSARRRMRWRRARCSVVVLRVRPVLRGASGHPFRYSLRVGNYPLYVLLGIPGSQQPV